MLNIRPLDFYILRVPTLPYNKVLDINTHHSQSIDSLSVVLKKMYSDNKLQEALYLASPQVYQELIKWIEGNPVSDFEKLILTLYKYLLRNGFRCTPYGLFAGCALGSISESGSRIIIKDAEYNRMTRLDMGYMMQIVKVICETPFLENELLFTNSSLYKIGDTYRYCEYNVVEGSRDYFLSELEKNEYLDIVVDAARQGIHFNNLVTLLVENKISSKQAMLFVKELVQLQILEPGIYPKLTDSNILNSLLDKLKKTDFKMTSITRHLEKVNELLQDKSSKKIESFKKIKDELKSIVPNISSKDLIQTDLILNLKDNNLHKSTVQEIVNMVAELSVLNPNSNNPDLEEFKRNLYLKYEEQELPLLEVLDTDLGLGYGNMSGDSTYYSPIINDLTPDLNKVETIVLTPYLKWLLKSLIASQKNNTHINITGEDLQQFAPKEDRSRQVQSSFHLMGSIIAKSQAKIDKGNYKFLLKSCGSSGAFNLMARFSKEGDPLYYKIKDSVVSEVQQQPNKVFAEIIHHAGSRIGNILTRPPIYAHEISFLGNTSAQDDLRISAADLLISVRNNRLILRSKKLNKEIIPRLTSAHNYKKGLPLYKFLCDLQYQDFNLGIKWNWGMFDNEPFLPRVTFKKIILSPARWFIKTTEFTQYFKAPETTEHKALNLLIKQKSVANKVLLAEGDNELYIDLSCWASREIVIAKLKKGDVILLEHIESAFLKDGENVYANELIIPVKNNHFVPKHEELFIENKEDRTYLPGSDWLYLKIYTSNKCADDLLLNDLPQIVKTLQKANLISKWFFIRYKDPENHLRIRFKKEDKNINFEKKIIAIIKKALSPYVNNNIIYKIQYDTYRQEIEKYGQDSIEWCETIFFNDSELVLNIIDNLSQSGNDSLRWLAALKVIDDVLNDFGFDIERKYQFAISIHRNFFKEFNGSKKLQLQLDNKFRQNRKQVEDTLSSAGTIFGADFINVINKRKLANGEVVKAINITCGKTIIERLTTNFIHLFINRLFPANQRLVELTLYHLLIKFYSSKLARLKK